MPESSIATIAVLGAGVIGLQTALSLLTSQEKPVVVVAQHFPSDSHGNIDYTSPMAGGHWRSHAHAGPEDEELRSWDTATYLEWKRLLNQAAEKGASAAEVEQELGLGIRESVMFWSEETEETREGGRGLWWRDVVSGFRPLEVEEAETGGAKDVVFAARYDSICINVPRYLAYLTERVIALGGKLIKASVRSDAGVEGLVADLQNIICPGHYKLNIIVLATGLLSRNFLPKEEAEKLYPIRGQTVLVEGESSKAITHVFPKDEISYVIPRPGSGTTILGGCKLAGNWDETEDNALTHTILKRATKLVPQLLASNGQFDVVSVQVGRRPGREGGPRLELEEGLVHGVRVIHAYGHSGAGYQNSVGSAEKVVKLIAALQ